MSELTTKSCAPCRGDVPRLDGKAIEALLPQVSGWQLVEPGGAGAVSRLTRRFELADFAAAMTFVNTMAALAEAEGHHPDFSVRYRVVDVELSTHDVSGLSENDFILAAKISEAFSTTPGQSAPRPARAR